MTDQQIILKILRTGKRNGGDWELKGLQSSLPLAGHRMKTLIFF